MKIFSFENDKIISYICEKIHYESAFNVKKFTKNENAFMSSFWATCIYYSKEAVGDEKFSFVKNFTNEKNYSNRFQKKPLSQKFCSTWNIFWKRFLLKALTVNFFICEIFNEWKFFISDRLLTILYAGGSKRWHESVFIFCEIFHIESVFIVNFFTNVTDNFIVFKWKIFISNSWATGSRIYIFLSFVNFFTLKAFSPVCKRFYLWNFSQLRLCEKNHNETVYNCEIFHEIS